MILFAMLGVTLLVLSFVLYVDLNRGIPGYAGNKPEKSVVIV